MRRLQIIEEVAVELNETETVGAIEALNVGGVRKFV